MKKGWTAISHAWSVKAARTKSGPARMIALIALGLPYSTAESGWIGSYSELRAISGSSLSNKQIRSALDLLQSRGLVRYSSSPKLTIWVTDLLGARDTRSSAGDTQSSAGDTHKEASSPQGFRIVAYEPQKEAEIDEKEDTHSDSEKATECLGHPLPSVSDTRSNKYNLSSLSIDLTTVRQKGATGLSSKKEIEYIDIETANNILKAKREQLAEKRQRMTVPSEASSAIEKISDRVKRLGGAENE